jgi:ankyrin repeat protein
VNTLEDGDNTTPIFWAAAEGHFDVVRRLADEGADLVGRGDDHALEVIGWATCFGACQTDIANFLVSRGARHHIFSAIAMDLADEVRRIAAERPAVLNSRLTRNENHRTPLHHAVVKNRPGMVSLLIELGADPLAVDGSGMPVAGYAESPDVDRPVMRAIHAMTDAEIVSAERGRRPANAEPINLIAALALGRADTAARLIRDNAPLISKGPSGNGVLHLMAKRNDAPAVGWLLAQGANPNGRWAHWDAEVTPLHLAAMNGHVEVARLLLEAGADPRIRDSRHDAEPIGWASYFGQRAVEQLLTER